MTTHLDAVKDYVINVVANDYENLELITKEVSSWASSEGRSVTPALIVDAISELVKEGLVGCFRFSTSSGKYETTDFKRDKTEELWFLISSSGKKLLAAQGVQQSRDRG
jgi:hypothetical protein